MLVLVGGSRIVRTGNRKQATSCSLPLFCARVKERQGSSTAVLLCSMAAGRGERYDHSYCTTGCRMIIRTPSYHPLRLVRRRG